MAPAVIVIIGAGVIGLSVGWRLALAGHQVTVIDAGPAARGASWAAAGMLAPQVEAEPGEEALLPLLLESRDMWPRFAAELEDASGLPLGYRDDGTLVVALDHDDREKLADTFAYHQTLGLDLEWLSGRDARAREPGLARGVTGGVWSAADHQIDNRALMPALIAAFEKAGGILRERLPVAEIISSNGGVTGVRTDTGDIAADHVVLAAGAWSGGIAGIPENCHPPVRPVKGQMLAVQMDPNAPLIRHVIWGPDIYLVPRDDGRLLIGATVEEMGFDTTLTAGGQYELLRAAWETLPGIYDLPIIETWAGLRPASRDDAPILGPTALDGLIMATGHHRNGILLAPLTAAAIGNFIDTGMLPGTARDFTLERFGLSGAA